MSLLRDTSYCILSLLNFPLLKYLYIFIVKVTEKSNCQGNLRVEIALQPGRTAAGGDAPSQLQPSHEQRSGGTGLLYCLTKINLAQVTS